MTEEDLKKHWETIYFSESCHEKEIIDSLPRIIPEDTDVFIDLGASAGQYIYFVNQILRNKTLLAIEADPARYKILKENCLGWSKIGNNKILVVNKAIHEKHGQTISFLSTHTDISGSLFLNKHIADLLELRDLKVTQTEVKTVSLASLLDEFQGKKIFIKMDVEGAEHSVIRRSYKELQYNDVSLLVEIHPWKDPLSGSYPWDIFRYFYKAGFVTKYYKKHFLLKKSSNALARWVSNALFATVVMLQYWLDKIRKTRLR